MRELEPCEEMPANRAHRPASSAVWEGAGSQRFLFNAALNQSLLSDWGLELGAGSEERGA